MSVARIKVVGITHWITTQHTGLVGEILEYVSSCRRWKAWDGFWEESKRIKDLTDESHVTCVAWQPAIR